MNNNNKYSYRSIKSQLSLLMFAMILITIFFVAIINWLFLDKYYIYKTELSYEKCYNDLLKISNEYSKDSELYFRELTNRVNKFSSETNASIIIKYKNENSKYIIVGINDVMNAIIKHDNYLNNKEIPQYDKQKRFNTATLIKTKDSFVNGEMVSNIEMWGKLDLNTSFIMFSKVSDIKRVGEISTQFLGVLGLLIMMFSLYLINSFSNYFTTPINNINSIAKNMSKLDFSQKYLSKSFIEIDELGQSINTMNDTLKNNINKLRETNIELSKEIEKHNTIDAMSNDFVESISHELKTPLALIMGYAEGLKEGITGKLSQEAEYYCDVIIDESKRMDKLVKNLLLIREFEYDRVKYHIEEFDIVEEIKNIITSYRILLNQKGVEVNIISNGTIIVYSDFTKIETVIRNYLTNAINHVDEKKVIEISVVLKDNGHVRVGVYNSGVQLTDEQISRLWDKFYRTDKARARAYGGSGIGLSLVKAIFEQSKKPYGCRNYKDGVEFFFEVDTEKSLKEYV